MKDLTRPYERLQEYFYIIKRLGMSMRNSGEYRIPLNSIVKEAGVPIEVFRADICCLLEVAKSDYDLVIDDENVLDNYETDEDYDWKSFRKDVCDGKYDDAELEVIYFDYDEMLLELTADESGVMEQVLHEYYNRRRGKTAPFLIKDSYHFMFHDVKTLNYKLYSIRAAIKERKEIKIKDMSENIKVMRVLKPVKLFYDTTDNLYAVICLDEEGLKAYRIDKLDFAGVGRSFEYPDDLEKRLSIVPNVWGLDFSDKPMNVRVRFYTRHSKGNVGRSVRKDLERRINGKLTEEDEYLIYEDKVYGKAAFLRWLFSYGNSAVLEKPVSLKKEIISIVKKELKEINEAD